MTMRTYTYYRCACGHVGHELLSENDQPYSQMWERTTYHGLAPGVGDHPKCGECGEQLSRANIVPKPT